jgi:hypothetical protein
LLETETLASSTAGYLLATPAKHFTFNLLRFAPLPKLLEKHLPKA